MPIYHSPHSFLPSFYTVTGEIDTISLAKIAPDLKDLIGWYTFRRGVSLGHSYRDQRVHQRLSQLLGISKTLVKGSFTCRSAHNAATQTYDHCFASLIAGKTGFDNAKFELSNLDHSMHDGYTTMTTTNLPSEPTAYTHNFNTMITTLKRAQADESGTSLHTVESSLVVKAFNDGMELVARKADQVAESDAQVASLQRELKSLRPKRYHRVSIPQIRPGREEPGSALAQSTVISTNPFAQNPHSPPRSQPPNRVLSTLVAKEVDISTEDTRQLIASGTIEATPT